MSNTCSKIKSSMLNGWLTVCISCVHWTPHHLNVMDIGVCDGHTKRIASCYYWKIILSVSGDEKFSPDYGCIEEKRLMAWELKRQVL